MQQKSRWFARWSRKSPPLRRRNRRLRSEFREPKLRLREVKKIGLGFERPARLWRPMHVGAVIPPRSYIERERPSTPSAHMAFPLPVFPRTGLLFLGPCLHLSRTARREGRLSPGQLRPSRKSGKAHWTPENFSTQ